MAGKLEVNEDEDKGFDWPAVVSSGTASPIKPPSNPSNDIFPSEPWDAFDPEPNVPAGVLINCQTGRLLIIWIFFPENYFYIPVKRTCAPLRQTLCHF
jgi:hypothetical protein